MSSRGPKKKKNQETKSSEKINPFEVKTARQKHDVLNRKILGSEQRPGQARAAAQQKRKATLGIEYNQRWKRNKFIDRRFGENDENLSYEDRMLLRFQKTRQRLLSRQSIYNLDEEELTHMGQSLSTLDEFRDEGTFLDSIDDEDEDDGKIDKEIVRDLHFGGFQPVTRKTQNSEQTTESEQQPQRPKTKKEIMEEIIAKSKYFKAQRAKEREARLELTEQLDAEFKNIRDLLSFSHSKKAKKTTTNDDKQQHDNLSNENQETEISKSDQSQAKEQNALHIENQDKGSNNNSNNNNKSKQTLSSSKNTDDDYDQLVRQLMFEPRAQPSNPLLTPEQLAKAEHERLQQLEAARIHRMNAEKVETSEDEEDEENEANSKSQTDDIQSNQNNEKSTATRKISSKQNIKNKKISPDDLGDEDYMNIIQSSHSDDELDNINNVKMSREDNVDDDDNEIDEENQVTDEGSDDTDQDRDIDSNDVDDEERENMQSDNHNNIGEEESSLGSSSKDKNITNDEDSMSLSKSELNKEHLENEKVASLLPSTPLSELLQLNPHKYKEVKDLKPDDELPYTLAMPSTFDKFNALFNGQSPTRQSTLIKRLQTCYHPSLSPYNKDIIKYFYWFLLKRFLWLGKQTPTVDIASIDVLVPPLFELSQLIPDFAGHLSRHYLIKIESSLFQKLENLSEMQHKPWISLHQLFLLKLLSYIWPVSDRRHVVATPAMLLMGQLLTHTTVLNHYHLLANLLLTNTFIHWLTPAKRFASEPFNFLFGVLRAFTIANSPQNSTTSALPTYTPLVTIPSHLLQLSTSSLSSRNLKPNDSNSQTSTIITTSHDNNHVSIAQQTDEKIKVSPLDINLLTKNNFQNPIFQTDEFRVSLLHATVKSLEELIRLYDSNEAYIELLRTAVILLRDIPLHCLPTSFQEYIQRLCETTEKRIRLLEANRQPLQLHKTKPQPLPLLTPDFKGTEYVPTKYKTKDKAERERKMLLRKYKQELKGAERELRKDSIFLEQQRMQKYLEQKEEKEKKQKEIWQWLESLQHEFNAAEKAKKRKTSDL